MPPQWMWHLDEPLDDWFADVEAKREDKYSGSAKNDDSSGGWMQNEFAKGRR